MVVHFSLILIKGVMFFLGDFILKLSILVSAWFLYQGQYMYISCIFATHPISKHLKKFWNIILFPLVTVKNNL